ncbi:hypothetical protein BJ912DRAFT_944063 [Pholiota molesta]|nr:hypothetical protein BJ912DRAFT_944063 [Pholiota molesta]
MSTGLYEELGISRNATTEEIRKAYKKRALQTHPDRLPQGATAADKAESDEKFRRVNNAYEVLSDSKKRSEYDLHGVWPPPEEEFIGSRMPGGSHQRDYPRSHYPSRGQTFPDPFYPHHHRPFSGFEFTDPFTLFNSIFEGTPFQSGPSRSRHHSYSSRSPFEHVHRMQAEIESFMDDIDRDPFSMGGMGPRFGFGPMLAMPSLPSPNGRGRWVSESVVSSTVNGVTQTVRKRVDSNGNEHITRTLPDGREVRTINGIEQPPNEYLPQIDQPKSRRVTESSGHRYIPPAPAHSQPIAPSRMDYGVHAPPPPYTPNPAAYRDAIPPTDRSRDSRRSRKSSDKYAYVPNINPDPRSHEERQHRKKFWQH